VTKLLNRRSYRVVRTGSGKMPVRPSPDEFRVKAAHADLIEIRRRHGWEIVGPPPF
jgi:hypothetical protein